MSDETPRRLALELVKPFEDESECALPSLVDAVESAIIAAEAKGAERASESSRAALGALMRWAEADAALEALIEVRRDGRGDAYTRAYHAAERKLLDCEDAMRSAASALSPAVTPRAEAEAP